jgi:hypothetical protein
VEMTNKITPGFFSEGILCGGIFKGSITGNDNLKFEFGFQKVVLIKMTLFRFAGKFPEALSTFSKNHLYKIVWTTNQAENKNRINVI